MAAEGGAPITRIFGVNLHDLDELGEGQEYQDFFREWTWRYALEASDLELVIGLDQGANDSFVMPVKQQLEVFEDPDSSSPAANWLLWFHGAWISEFSDNRRIMLGVLLIIRLGSD